MRDFLDEEFCVGENPIQLIVPVMLESIRTS
jgi:hypothetical protein